MVEISLSGSGEGPRGQTGGYSTPPQRREIKQLPKPAWWMRVKWRQRSQVLISGWVSSAERHSTLSDSLAPGLLAASMIATKTLENGYRHNAF